ncbi:MAG: HAMP domain-containing histidine kinase [Clostridia bacterium]|nr:HAMP domain-containing histidine kinase [Clostridia bacterium]
MAMRRKSITSRWMVNGVGVIILVLVFLVVAGTLMLRYLYYESVSDALYEYADATSGTFSVYLSDSSHDWATASREFLANFQDKSQVEVQVLDAAGDVQMTSTGFMPDANLKADWQTASQSSDGYGLWTGRYSSGERVMSLVTLVQQNDTVSGGLRVVVSLRLVDRQLFLFSGLLVLLALLVVFFVMLSSSYFVSSIINPVKEIGRGAQTIAAGNYGHRIPKRDNDEIGDLCDTINYMAGEIANSEQLKNDFISSISHELRTPLTAIKGWSETLSQVGDSNAELTERGLRIISDETSRLSALVEELLDFSRLQDGRLAIRTESFNVINELEETVLLYRPRAERENIRLYYAETTDIPPIEGDKDRIRQVLINVMDNAVKYTKSGGVIRAEAARVGDTVQIVISDTGIGIPPEDLVHVKEKFFRVNKNGSIPGSGIGLALADEVTRLHGGRLDIDSVVGKGTTVTVTLPIKKGA